MIESFTQIPNFYFDFLPHLTESANKCYLCICRHTLGWHKQWAVITRKDFCLFTGLLPQAVRSGIALLIDIKMIFCEIKGRERQYGINMTSEQIGVKITPKDRGENHPQVGVKITPKKSKIGVKITPTKGWKSPLSVAATPITPKAQAAPKEILKKININTHKESPSTPMLPAPESTPDQEPQKSVCVEAIAEEKNEEKKEEPLHQPENPIQAPIPLERILEVYPVHDRMSLSKAQAAWDTLTNPEKELACLGARRYADDCKQSSNYNPSYTTHLHTFLLGREWAKAKQPDQAVPPQAKAPEDEVYRRLVEKEDLAYSDWQSHKRMATSDNPAMQRIADPAGHQQRYEERKKQRQEYEQTQQ